MEELKKEEARLKAKWKPFLKKEKVNELTLRLFQVDVAKFVETFPNWDRN